MVWVGMELQSPVPSPLPPVQAVNGISEQDFPCCFLSPAKPHLLSITPPSCAIPSCALCSRGCWWCFLFVLCPPVERDGSGAGRARPQVRQGPEREPRGAEMHRVCAAPVPAVHHRRLQGAGEALPSSSSLQGAASGWLRLQLLRIPNFSNEVGAATWESPQTPWSRPCCHFCAFLSE